MPGTRITFRPPLRPTRIVSRSPATPFPVQSPGFELFVRGTHALRAGVSAIGLEPGDQVLVPAYHHGAEIDALIRAGLTVTYYGARPDLAPDPEELAALAGPRCRALLLIHVLGFPQDGAYWRTWCDRRGLLLIEDAAHAWAATAGGRPVGSHGDLAIFCPYESLPLPRISASVARVTVRFASTLETGAPGAAPGAEGRRPGPLAALLLHRLAEDPSGMRRENYRLLLEQLADLVPAPFDVLPDGASPLGFPVMVPGKAALLERLSCLGIDAWDFWAAPHPSLDPPTGATAAHRRRSTVVLPVHQGLQVRDLDRIAEAVRPSRRPVEEFRAEPVDDFESLRGEWSELALETRNVFATWEWNRTWWEHFGGGRPLALTALRDGRGRLRAILPLYLWVDRPVRIARFLGHVAGDQLQPVCAPADRPAVARAIRGLLRESRWQLLMADRLPAAEAWGKRLSGRVLHRESSPVLFLDGSWEEVTKAWSPRFRSQLRRLERRLRADHDVQVRTVDDPEDLDKGLTTFFDLHRSRWTTGTKFEEREPFHREFARVAFDNGWLRLRITEADGLPVAAILNFRYCGVEFGYQSGWRPEFADHSVGTVQLADAIRTAHADGIREYRFLRGGESYKYRFAGADAGLETVVLRAASLPGAVAAAGAALADSAPARHLRQRSRPHA